MGTYFLLSIPLIGLATGYVGLKIFKLTVPLWVAVIFGMFGAFLTPIIMQYYVGGGFIGAVIVQIFGSILFVWVLTFSNRTNQTILQTPKTNPHNAQNATYSINRIEEAQTSYEANGYEERAIDNSKNDGYIKRRLTISREWTRVISIEKSATNSYSSSLGLTGFFDLSLERALQDKYHVEINERKIFTEEIELEVLPRSKTVLRIEWKTIWQNGVIEIIDEKQNMLFIPYKVSKGLTFDQVQEKVN